MQTDIRKARRCSLRVHRKSLAERRVQKARPSEVAR
jgi:hypothetical protein